MITFHGLIRPTQKKQDGTWNVKVRVTYNRKSCYHPTNMFVTKDDLNTKQNKITNKVRIKKIENLIDQYRKMADDIQITSSLTTSKIIAFIVKGIDKNEKQEVDFTSFITNIILTRKKKAIKKQDKTAIGYQTVLNSLHDYFKTNRILITDITSRSLQGYEDYLKTERKAIRPNKYGKPVQVVLKPVGNGINNYLRDIRALFNDAMEEYNDEDNNEMVITHYPFKKFKITKPQPTKKRNIKVDAIKTIRDFKPAKAYKRPMLGRDIFMLSFYLVGMNLVDLFEAEHLSDGQLIYNRSKTENRRDDKALISIKVEQEALQLIEKYRDPNNLRVFSFYKEYKTINAFTKAVNFGLKKVSEELKLKVILTSGYARASWATIARNVCKISKDDVDLALNHLDLKHKLADIYIEKDFKIIDESNRKVIDTLR